MILAHVVLVKNINNAMENNTSKSLELAKKFLKKEVEVVIDRQLGTKHPKHDFVYEVNYGYIPNVLAPDGEELDAYYLGVNEPLEKAKGIVKAIVHRLDDDDDKLVVMPKDIDMTEEQIEKAVSFQEQWFDHQILK
jgi:inorganic pyrophosphatase